MTRTTNPADLGPNATEQDAIDFDAAVARVLPALDEEGAREFVWNRGAIRFNADICLYCDHPVPDDTIVPDPQDEEGWAEQEPFHGPSCEWVRTMAHRA